MKGIVYSGGGAKGAWGAGVTHGLIKDYKKSYDILGGSSTGSLLMLLTSINDTDRLKTGYTNVTNKDIYTLKPYKIINSSNGIYKTKMNYLKIAWNILIRKQKTFGDSGKLREELIPRFFKEVDFNKSIDMGKEMITCVTNLTKGCTEYKSSLEYSYDDFLDYVYASTCASPFMSILEKDNFEYADGGFLEHMPVQALIDKGCTEIDVIDLAQENVDIEKVRSPLHLINRVIDIILRENAKNDFKLAKLNALEEDVIINVYSPDRKLTNNPLVFDKDIMLKWWNEGYEYIKRHNHSSYIIYADSRKAMKRIK